MTLQEIRQQYPQYEDMSDAQLARALHARYYSDMDFGEFSQRVGLQAAEPPSRTEMALDTVSRMPGLGFLSPEVRQAGAEVGRQAGLAGRHIVEGVAAIPAMVAQPVADVADLGLQAAGSDFRFGNQRQGVSRLLDRANLPRPQNPLERVVGDASQALTAGGGIVGTAQRFARPALARIANARSQAPNSLANMLAQAPGLQAAGEIAGGGGAGITREMGANPLTQIMVGAGAGFAAPASLMGATALGRGLRGVGQTLSDEGRNSIAARLLQEQATDPRRAADNLASAREVVPGSLPTSGPASRDVGLLAFQRGLRSRNPAEFGARESQQNAARQQALDRIAGTPEDIARQQAARDSEAIPMLDAAMDAAGVADVSGVDRLISRIMSGRSGMRQPVETALNSVRRRLYEDYPEDQMIRDARDAVQGVIGRRMSGADHNGLTQARTILNSTARGHRGVDEAVTELRAIGRQLSSKTASEAVDLAIRTLKVGNVVYNDSATRLYGVREHIGDLLAGNAGLDRQSARAAERELLAIREALDNAIERAAPGFRAYLARYAEMSKPINQMEVLQELQRRSTMAAPDISSGRDILSQAQFTRNLDNILSDPRRSRDLTPEQIATARAVAADLDSAASINAANIRAPGSDTYQNLSTANVIRNARGTGGRVSIAERSFLRPLDFLFKHTDAEIDEILTEAMLDPALAERLLRAPTEENLRAVGMAFSEKMRQLGYGSSVGSATASGQTEPQ